MGPGERPGSLVASGGRGRPKGASKRLAPLWAQDLAFLAKCGLNAIQRTFIAAISAIMLRLRIFLEIMKALNEEMTIFKLIGARRALDKKIDSDQFLAIFP